MYTYNPKLIRIIDGDTVDAMIDLGFDVWVKNRIRLSGIDTPETRTRNLIEKAKGFEAKNRLVEILDKSGGDFVIISEGRDKYGRCLGEIFVENISINQLLLDEGFAIPYNGGKKPKIK